VQGPRGPTGPKGDPGANAYFAGTGLGLAGGNTFNILGSYQLPQGCSNGQSPFLLGTPLTHPWSCFTAANANESCSSGKFQNGVDSGGDITCATPSAPAGPGVWITSVAEADAPSPEGLVAYLDLPAGTYLINVKGSAADDVGGDDKMDVECRLTNNGTEFDEIFATETAGSIEPDVPFTLTGAQSSAGAMTVDLLCQTYDKSDHVENVVMTALAIGTVTRQQRYAASRSTRSRTSLAWGTYSTSSGPACSVP
jgi:hypothetical protein